MHERDPHCHWCGILTFLYESTAAGQGPATIDHLDLITYAHVAGTQGNEFLVGIRYVRSDQRVVLACSDCNEYRGWMKALLMTVRGRRALERGWEALEQEWLLMAQKRLERIRYRMARTSKAPSS